MKVLGKLVFWLIAALVGITIIVSATVKLKPVMWPYISKQIGPTDNEAASAIYRNHGENMSVRVDVPRSFAECDRDTTARFLIQARRIRLRSDCTVEMIYFEEWKKKNQEEFNKEADRLKTSNPEQTKEALAKWYYGVSARDISRFDILTKQPDGADYIVTYRVAVDSTPFSILLGQGEDLVKGFEGAARLRFMASKTSPVVDPPHWQLVETVEHRALR